MSKIQLKRNGQAVPFETLELHYENDLFLQGYMALSEGTGQMFEDLSLDIQPFVNYKEGYALYAFDLTPDHVGDKNFHLLHEGNISLDITLGKTSNRSITIVCYLEYDAIIEIDKDRNVYYE